jgi:hypothetical protein
MHDQLAQLTEVVAELQRRIEALEAAAPKRKKRERPTIEQWLEESKAAHPDWPEQDARAAWEYYERVGWVTGKAPIQKWKMCISTCYRNWKQLNRGGVSTTRRMSFA